jgi:hypothetical protein
MEQRMLSAKSEDEITVNISIEDHRFQPAELHAPAGKPIVIVVKNLDSAPAEFESNMLRVEKVVTGEYQRGSGALYSDHIGQAEFIVADFDLFTNATNGSHGGKPSTSSRERRILPCPRSVNRSQSFQKGAVFADIITRIIKLGREYEQRGIGAVLPLRGPNHGRNVNAHVWFVQHDFQMRLSIIDRDAALAVGANQKLMALFMRMFSTELSGWNTGNDKISLGEKWKFAFEFSDGQIATRIFNPGKPIDINSPHPGW